MSSPYLLSILIILSSAAQALEAERTQVYEKKQLASLTLPQTSKKQVTAKPLSKEDRHIRIGMQLHYELAIILSNIQSPQDAKTAIPLILKSNEQLLAWGKAFTTLPPIDEATQARFREQYIPIIKQSNAALAIQGKRLKDAEYYGSDELPAALIRMVQELK